MLKFVLTGLVAGMFVAGTATAASETSVDESRCLRPALIDGFKSATRTSVILTQGSREWRVDTAGTCTGLDWAQDIATKSRTACFTAGDSLIFNDGSMRQTCMVKDVTYLPKDAAK